MKTRFRDHNFIVIRLILLFGLLILLAVSMSSCSAVDSILDSITSRIDGGESGSEAAEEEGQAEVIRIPQTGFTNAVPEEYTLPSSRPGTIEDLYYGSNDYSGNHQPIEKHASIYLPYGYDPNDDVTRYDILYMTHVWGGSEEDYFNVGDGMIRNMLDHMIEQGEIPPLIVVSATFYDDYSYQDLSSSIEEVREFHEDLREYIIPAVEDQYHTYADSIRTEDLEQSRDHRAFGGFSLGGVATWNEFCYDYDLIRYFLPMSGPCYYYGGYDDFYPEETCDFLEDLIERNNLNERGYFIYAATGTEDSMKYQVDNLMDEVLARSDFFTPEHIVYYQRLGGEHDFESAMEYLYNALPLFFRNTPEQEGSS